ncbi:MAG TPA: cysteine--tRNA ligase [Acholeplasmatales bacterium]|nr:cysteine--tRNA ligase [Acholeplasmatales bacterium]
MLILAKINEIGDMMGLMIYNSLTNKIEEFKTHEPGIVNMYVCGPTVYDYIHIGNARPVIFYDMLKNYLEYIGYKVNYASNITDVDDKIINKALEQGVSEEEIAKKYEDAYFKNCNDLGSKRPTFVPHATAYIKEMLDFIGQLVNKGYAYEVNGDVYFRVNHLDSYGVLSNQVQEELQNGVRKDVDTKKENPLDFVLWKKTNVGIKWPSIYGPGRPGWHTECVCMIDKIFNHKMIDIHGGGMDLKFPHHENEIAQAKAMYGNTLASYWMHVGRLNLKGQKMSKSLGNVILVNDFKTQEDLMSLRLLIVTQPYRNSISYDEELFNQYKKEYDKFTRAYKNAMLALDYNNYKSNEVIKEDKEAFINYMNQDLNCQNVMSLASSLLKELNSATRAGNLDVIAKKANMIKQIMDVFGVMMPYTPLNDETRKIYNEWVQAKSVKNFEEADKLRAVLTEAGVI